MTIGDRKNLAVEAAMALREQAGRLEACGAPAQGGPWTLHFGNLKNEFEAIKQDIRDLTASGDRCVYVFELTDPTAIVQIRAAMIVPKADRTSEFAGAKHNKYVPDTTSLYVGSSYATIIAAGQRKNTLLSRISQHLGLTNSKKTYAMHLNEWATHVHGGVRITVYQYPRETDRREILAIEDYLSTSLEPLLGKRGSAR